MAVSKAGSAQHIYASLKNSILGLNLAPGTRISEKDISLRFNVSRTPVREAFIALAGEALLTVSPQKGTTVSLIDFERVTQELFLRENLEPAALRLFARNRENAELSALEQNIALQEDCGAGGKLELFFRYDNAFHRTIFAGQPLAWEVLENTCGHYYRIRLLSGFLEGKVKHLIEEHKKIFRAIKRNDADKALEILDAHIHAVGTEKSNFESSFPDYFTDSGEEPPLLDFGGLKL